MTHIWQSVEFHCSLHGHVPTKMRKLDVYKFLGVKRPVPVPKKNSIYINMYMCVEYTTSLQDATKL